MALPTLPNLNRRRFLIGGSVLGLAAGLPGHRFMDSAAAETPRPAVPGAAWDKLADKLAGPLLRKGDRAFTRFATPFNLAYAQIEPGGIAVCFTAEDVKTAIAWARENEVPLVARSGGHSYAGYSTTTGLMIDVSSMRWANRNGPDLLTVGSGSRNSDLYAALRALNRTTTHGRCPTVGIAGFLLGGGIGFNMRRLGIASDHLIATDIVLADGSFRSIAADRDGDLFWACRGGGGGNFGINTSFTIRTFPAQRVSVFRYDWQGTAGEIVAVADILMQTLTDAPAAFGSRFSLRPPNRMAGGDKFSLNLIGQYGGPATFILRLMRAAERAAPLSHHELYELDYWDGQDFLAEHDGPFRFHERSLFLSKPLSHDDLVKAAEYLAQWKGTRNPHQLADLRFFQTGGQINKIAASETAFVHRDSVWLMDIGLPWSASDPEEVVNQNIAWQNAFYEAVLSFGNGHAYQNFIDPALKDFAAAYYGGNLGKLARIKAKYDPDSLFHFPQSVPSAAP
ncbi:MAG TPA: FAD-binding oxidoreductase [Acetobacteraceae bacterium]|nr:FAD-binding oxidoreductase [Acetobacteraceae bacterium]